MNNSFPLVSISIISHGQSSLVSCLLDDLSKLQKLTFEVLLTVNIPEDVSAYKNRPFPLKLFFNDTPKGFGANHNSAFIHINSNFFVVINPDIRISSINFSDFIPLFDDPNVAAVGPLILSNSGFQEDSVRRFPTLGILVKRVIFQMRLPDYKISKKPFPVDWVAGMFMFFHAESFRKINGFDEKRFYMYMEDVDICERLFKSGKIVLFHPLISVVHNAQRSSHKNVKYLKWHIISAFRYLTGL